jgi:hypothetical protein
VLTPLLLSHPSTACSVRRLEVHDRVRGRLQMCRLAAHLWHAFWATGAMWLHALTTKDNMTNAVADYAMAPQ